MKPEDRKRLKQHIEMIVEHKTPVEELEDTIRRLRVELHTLRFKESQEQRFIWWVREVFAKNVQDTVAGIIEACTYQDEPTAAAGKYGLPIKCFEMMRRLTEYTHGIYDGTYLDVEISAVVKNQKSLGDEVMEIIQAALSGDCQKYLSYDLQGNKYCKWGIVEKDIRALFETSTDNNKLDIHTLEYAAKWIENSLVGETNERVIEFGKNMAMSIRAAKPSISDVSVTQDVSTDSENDQLRAELARRDDLINDL